MCVFKSMVFWVVTQCNLVKVYRRFGGRHRLHLQVRRIKQVKTGRRGGKPATNRLSYGTAFVQVKT
jgi:hypothetical protein